MAHWFDTLARPHTRRTALKSAGLAGAALLLPIAHTPEAVADVTEPCYPACVGFAQTAKNVADQSCTERYGVRGFGESAPLVGGLFKSLRNSDFIKCRATANTLFNSAKYRCHTLNDCGDPSRYPNGAAPTPVPVTGPGGPCGEGHYIKCGANPCCDLSNATCQDCKSGPVCCVINGNCCGGSG